jgi:hypothetical protein
MPARNAPTFIVYRNGQIAPELQALRVQRSLGAQRLDHAELMIDTTKVPTFNGLDDFSPFDYLGSSIDIKSSLGPYVHQGTVVQVAPRFNPKEAGLSLVSRTEEHQFGLTLFGQLHWNPVLDEYFISDDDLLFNPTIDGKTQGNKHDSKTYKNQQFANQTQRVTNEIPIFLHPDSSRSAAARQLHRGRNTSWVLSEVIYYLCWMANRQQTFLVNPTMEELRATLIDSVDLVRNLKVKAGSTLPEALDVALNPLGYYWRLVNRGAFALNYLEIIRRATGGKLTWLKHQRLREPLNTALTNTEALGVRFDTTRLANQVIAKGAKIQVEITAELYRGWPASLDETPLDELKDSVVKMDENPDKKNVWRKWVLNEAGDYIGTRPEIKSIFTEEVFIALKREDLLRWFLPRRRSLLPTITTNADINQPIGGEGRGIVIEYRDYDGTWRAVKRWGIELLDNECGILITREDIPEELYDQAQYGAIRVTATIEADYALTRMAFRQANSPVFEVKEAYIDLSDNYQQRVVLPGSKYADSSDNLEADDTQALANFAESLRSRFDQIDVPGGVVLEGVDQLDYLPGDRVAGVQGKNISFAVKRGAAQYPQIVSVTLDIDAQKTILQLQRFREFRPQ